MNIDDISAPMQNYTRSRSSLGNRFNNSGIYNSRNTRAHNPSKTTMPKSMFEKYVKNCICYGCGKKGHLKKMCPNSNRNSKLFSNIQFNTTTLQHIKKIFFKLFATMNKKAVYVLLDTGSQITTMTYTIANKLCLKTIYAKAIKLRLENNSASKTSNKMVTAVICFGNTKFNTTFKLMDAQPYNIILALSTADLGSQNSSNYDMDNIKILQSVSSFFDPKPSIIHIIFFTD
ncbi:hypothetical protein BB561_006154 [Smittium simulii]|uniref:CCHC-type domain-containing protein n=1 Tax=Smittium simulii TaxID=133385 RepID=A0A2T9Y683_9FUNG|nr:hypothetical protein BB561_006154 [Smittium simulii]